jgi:hypothetical protein
MVELAIRFSYYIEDEKLAFWFWVSTSRSRHVVDSFQGPVPGGRL